MRLGLLIVVGMTMHLVMFGAVLELYFTYPLVHVDRLYSARMDPPAKRIVLISADGLRADKLFALDDAGNPRAPFLRSMLENKGIWGIAHTRIPTGSRHGHVAMISGYYETIVAVTKGWSENVGEFDSTFNQSRYAWAWGSHKVLSMFPEDKVRCHVENNSPPPGMEKIANPEQLDKWVLDSVASLLESAKKNETLMSRLKEGKVMFFLHLMGLDTTSHSHKPYSEHYAKHVRAVDDLIRQLSELMDRFFDDNKTTYIVTSDHGMTDWGAHAAGDPLETRTPLVIWGPGIRKPRATNTTCGNFGDNLCQEWRIQHRARTDMSQTDIAPLISYLLNIPYPANNMGLLPIDILSVTEREKAEGMAANAQQIFLQYQVKRKEVEDSTPSILFYEFQELPASDEASLTTTGWNLMRSERYSESITKSRTLIDKALLGLHYYQSYHQGSMCAILTLFFLGWMSFLLLLMLSQGASPVQHSRPIWKNIVSLETASYFIGISSVVLLWLYINGLPWTYTVYSLLAVFLWMKFQKGSQMLFAVVKQVQGVPLVISLIFCVVCLELYVMCFFYTSLLSVGLVAMAAWSFTTPLWRVNRRCCVRWIASCLLIAVFPALPVPKGNNYYSLVLIAGLLTFLLGSYLLKRLLHHNSTVDIVPKAVLCFQLALIGVATLILKVATDRIAVKAEPLPATQLISWFILLSSPVLPCFTGASLEVRLFSVGLALAAPFILLCYTYDGFLYLAFIYHLHCWLRLETALISCQTDSNGHLPIATGDASGTKTGPSNGHCPPLSTPAGTRNDPPVKLPVNSGDLRRGLFCILLMIMSFFGADNVPSINTHDPVLAFCFFASFKPPGLMTLILVKAAIPFLLVLCTLRAVLSKTRGSARANLLLILLMMDFIILNFFFLVGDKESWQEVGAAISRYTIASLMFAKTICMLALAHFLVPLPVESS